ncbi:hypothetical protein RDWZM_009600 [Blomia tropicalis]|uniref:G domain-containing protein n=1 Tax=Blomia tropicalis TaxID=40697 RepID=A0A9Q0M4B8_BLOTA|nr:hypothetical protein RDWZM_009600 [Blomia tropicalis]
MGEILSNEQILNELFNLYMDPEHGLLHFGESVGLRLYPPRRKMSVMLIGNHSSGKSSFINWYIDHKVQKTGVAIETQGFTIVSSGKIRETLTGKATILLYPHLKPLESIPGVLSYLSTELTPSTSRRFNLVTFIDTPGLADGKLHYPYDIERGMLWLGENSDLIFVFFDPIGQALCKRTLDLVEKLNQIYPERIRFFLSKADEAGIESDREKVMMQIVQELCKRNGLNQCGFEMSTIYIPNHANLKNNQQMCTNQIENACNEIEKTIAFTIQNTFNKMEIDIEKVEEIAHIKLDMNKNNSTQNLKCYLQILLLTLICLQFPLAIMLNESKPESEPKPKMTDYLNYLEFFESDIDVYLKYYEQFLDLLKSIFAFYMLVVFKILTVLLPSSNTLLYSCLISVVIAFLSKFYIRFQPTLSDHEISNLNSIIHKLQTLHRPRRELLYTNYLNQMLNENDL